MICPLLPSRVVPVLFRQEYQQDKTLCSELSCQFWLAFYNLLPGGLASMLWRGFCTIDLPSHRLWQSYSSSFYSLCYCFVPRIRNSLFHFMSNTFLIHTVRPGFGIFCKVIEIDNAIFPDLKSFRKGKIFKMATEKLWILVWGTSIIS